MSFYKTIKATPKEVTDRDLFNINISPSEEEKVYIKKTYPRILDENRDQIFFIHSCRILGDKFRGKNTYFTIKSERDCHNCLFGTSLDPHRVACILRSGTGIENVFSKSLLTRFKNESISVFPACMFENIHFEECKIS